MGWFLRSHTFCLFHSINILCSLLKELINELIQSSRTELFHASKSLRDVEYDEVTETKIVFITQPDKAP